MILLEQNMVLDMTSVSTQDSSLSVAVQLISVEIRVAAVVCCSFMASWCRHERESKWMLVTPEKETRLHIWHKQKLFQLGGLYFLFENSKKSHSHLLMLLPVKNADKKSKDWLDLCLWKFSSGALWKLNQCVQCVFYVCGTCSVFLCVVCGVVVVVVMVCVCARACVWTMTCMRCWKNMWVCENPNLMWE